MFGSAKRADQPPRLTNSSLRHSVRSLSALSTHHTQIHIIKRNTHHDSSSSINVPATKRGLRLSGRPTISNPLPPFFLLGITSPSSAADTRRFIRASVLIRPEKDVHTIALAMAERILMNEFVCGFSVLPYVDVPTFPQSLWIYCQDRYQQE